MNQQRILIADDDMSLTFALREFFCDNGFAVDCVLGLAEAERMLEQFSYSALVTDLHLSEQQCAEGLAMISQARLRQPAIRTVVITGFSSPQIEFDARRLGAHTVLTKPFSLPELRDVVLHECRR